jgi:hypothetical protein
MVIMLSVAVILTMFLLVTVTAASQPYSQLPRSNIKAHTFDDAQQFTVLSTTKCT